MTRIFIGIFALYLINEAKLPMHSAWSGLKSHAVVPDRKLDGMLDYNCIVIMLLQYDCRLCKGLRVSLLGACALFGIGSESCRTVGNASV